ncbi:hypothetical protein A2264_01110 [candidate division WWE3 bacterium RIFOXYA2_FULL_46_9]|uniref:Uncharacterized protein n=1 Tax=candidate division WWE3 bacterium RIFOXYA2_FULL_46_9 TaxID=1802636 RepID=A0A1F4W0M8_UNCKA|nr:MAG: hypothetical protein A2264_01110 [candidate division WWE3 bacterium RIFOXYA2_FULL_46_9]
MSPAAASAASTVLPNPSLDFVDEIPGDGGFVAAFGIESDGNTVGDRLLVSGQVGDDRVEGECTKVLAEFLQVTALVGAGTLEAGDQIPEEHEVRVVPLTDVFDSGGDPDDALCAPVGGLQGDHDVIGGAERREADQGEAWGAVEDDVFVAVTDRVQAVRKREVEVGLLPEALVGEVVGGERRGGGEEVDRGKPRRADEGGGIGLGAWVEEGLDAGEGTLAGGEEALRDVALRVGVDDEKLLLAFLSHAGQEPGSVGLPHAALQVDDGDDGGGSGRGALHDRQDSTVGWSASTDSSAKGRASRG